MEKFFYIYASGKCTLLIIILFYLIFPQYSNVDFIYCTYLFYVGIILIWKIKSYIKFNLKTLIFYCYLKSDTIFSKLPQTIFSSTSFYWEYGFGEKAINVLKTQHNI